MTWRNWSFIAVLILMNYIIFSLLGSFIFIPITDTTPTHTPLPTFTPGARALTPVAPLPYAFLTPSAIPGSVRVTATVAVTVTITSTLATVSPSLTPTRVP